MSDSKIDILLLGSGGREHALLTKLAESPRAGKMWVAPGNGGMDATAEVADLDPESPEGVAAWAAGHGIGLVVIGPEAPLVAGVADAVRAAGIPTFGPNGKAAQMEGSKKFAKEVMERAGVPTAAYRDEGTSYHYAPAADWIAVKNAGTVAAFMEEVGLPYVLGKTWTTDAFYRETRGNFERRKADGCVSVEMECAAAQAMCDFYGLQLYAFFTGGDQLDAPKWDARMNKEGHEGTQHDAGHLDIALELADYVTSHD